MKEFFSLLIMPLSILCELLIIGGILYLFNRKRATKMFLLLTGFWFISISTSLVPNYLISRLENSYMPLLKADSLLSGEPVYLIVLGGGHSDDKSLPPNSQLSVVALGRLIEGIRLHWLIPGSKLVVSGYSSGLLLSQAEVLYRTALSLGVKEQDIKVLSTTRNTSDEAKTFYSEFGKQNQLIIVTDAIHMPRAMKLFKKEGLNPIPAPTNYIVKHLSKRDTISFIPSSENIWEMEVAIHEYVGILWSMFKR
jgi:uncharacterized SAM-binding protein YcdF (DUF218 family)